jgi:hypothetical protein
MPTPPLGKLERIAEVRAVWPSERDFSLWLAEEANLAQLAASLGIDELELEATEKNVGPFKADILCKDTLNGHWVLIENQLSRTDHGHLGQLLTYAAGLQAVTVVWIAAPFTRSTGPPVWLSTAGALTLSNSPPPVKGRFALVRSCRRPAARNPQDLRTPFAYEHM